MIKIKTFIETQHDNRPLSSLSLLSEMLYSYLNEISVPFPLGHVALFWKTNAFIFFLITLSSYWGAVLNT